MLIMRTQYLAAVLQTSNGPYIANGRGYTWTYKVPNTE